MTRDPERSHPELCYICECVFKFNEMVIIVNRIRKDGLHSDFIGDRVHVACIGGAKK